MQITEYPATQKERIESVLAGRFHFAIWDLVEDMRECGMEEQEIDQWLFKELQSSLNEHRKQED